MNNEMYAAIRKSRVLRVAMGELVGKPMGGWGETQEALTALDGALPCGLSLSDFVPAVYCGTERYDLRPEYRALLSSLDGSGRPRWSGRQITPVALPW